MLNHGTAYRKGEEARKQCEGMARCGRSLACLFGTCKAEHSAWAAGTPLPSQHSFYPLYYFISFDIQEKEYFFLSKHYPVGHIDFSACNGRLRTVFVRLEICNLHPNTESRTRHICACYDFGCILNAISRNSPGMTTHQQYDPHEISAPYFQLPFFVL